MNRRNFSLGLFSAVLATNMPKASSAWGINNTRAVKLYNIHNKEKIHTVYWRNGYYDSDGILKLTNFFRDIRTGGVHHIDPVVFDIIWTLQEELNLTESGLQLVSGYRSPETNAMLRKRSKGVAKNSLHMRGLAADITSYDVKLSTLKNTAKSLKEGGVGYYPKSHFVHVDTGDLRYW